MSFTVDTSGFARGVAALSAGLKLNSKVVMKKEVGELMKTLVRVTPPSEPARTRKSIEASVGSKFASANQDFASSKSVGSQGVEWYAWNRDFLFGIMREDDLRQAALEELKARYYQLTKGGRRKVDFVAHRKHQQVLISQSLLTTRAQLSQLTARLKQHVGRLKAGWLVGMDVVTMSGANMPPEWVMRHRQGARGRYVNGLESDLKPSFTIANSAKGVDDMKVKFFAQKALEIRAKAMIANLRLFFKGKKQLSDYIR